MGAVNAPFDALASGAPKAAASQANPLLTAKPLLSPHVRLGAVRQRDGLVYRAHDRIAGRTSELTPFAAHLLLLCDGRRTVTALVPLMRRFRPGVADADLLREILGVVSGAETFGILLPLLRPEEGYAPLPVPGLLMRTLRNPLFARFSLFSPDPLIERMRLLAHLLFNPVSALVWVCIVAFGVWLVTGNWSDLVAYGKVHALQSGSLVWLLLLFPLIKILHEMGHALACKRWGGEVRDFGVMLLVLMPIPFVDCSDSAFFVRRRQRIVVAAAGMMVEFVIATLALCIWLVSTHELTRLLAFNTMVLTSITTIVFNANPLLRFDGYYILGELIGIDNLGTRSQRLIQTLARRFLLGDSKAVIPASSLGQRILFLVYGVASFIYKCLIVFVIVVSVFPQFFVFGLVLATWGAVVMIATPVAKQAASIYAYIAAGGVRAAARVGLRLGLLAAVLAVVFAIPVPYVIIGDGVVRLPPESIVRAGAAGTVERLPLGRAADVREGDTLFLLSNEILDAELKAQLASLDAQQRRYDASLARDIAEAALFRAEIDFLVQDIAQNMDNLARLTVVAGAEGRFTAADQIRAGVFVAEGDELGLVLPHGAERVALVSLSQEDADLVRSRLIAVDVRPFGGESRVRPATLAREYPVVTTPDTGVTGRVTTGWFAVELDIPDGADLTFGQAVAIRFDLGHAPLAMQIWRNGSIWIEKLMMSRHLGRQI